MSGRALLFSLAAAVAHAAWNALAKRAHDPLVFLWSSVSLASLGLMPLGVSALIREGWMPGGTPFVVATVGIHAVYFFALGRAYAAGDLSLVYPVARGLGVALVPLLAYLFLDERLSAVGALGIALVVADRGVPGSGPRTRPTSPRRGEVAGRRARVGRSDRAHHRATRWWTGGGRADHPSAASADGHRDGAVWRRHLHRRAALAAMQRTARPSPWPRP
jgi:multidrug transporter EmrE-like cation transporter